MGQREMHMHCINTVETCGILSDIPVIGQLTADPHDCLLLTLPGKNFHPHTQQATKNTRHKYLSPLFSSGMHNITYSERPLLLW